MIINGQIYRLLETGQLVRGYSTTKVLTLRGTLLEVKEPELTEGPSHELIHAVFDLARRIEGADNYLEQFRGDWE